jgi:hypothetical protein
MPPEARQPRCAEALQAERRGVRVVEPSGIEPLTS